jgi:hypothetical protein
MNIYYNYGSREAEMVQDRTEEIEQDILGDGKWSDYEQITDQVRQRVCDQVYDEAPRFVEAMWYAHKCPYPTAEQKARALAYLANFAGLIDDIFKDEVSDEAHRVLIKESDSAHESWELRHVD